MKDGSLILVIIALASGQIWMLSTMYSFYLLVVVGLLIAVILLYLGKSRSALIAISIIALLGVIGLIELFPVSVTLGGGFNDDTIGVEMISLFLFGFILFSHRKEAIKIWTGGHSNEGEIINSEMTYFTKKFKHRTDKELRDIIDDKQFYSESAKKAAKKLLESEN
ncbi:MAG: hypothetical protein AAGF85_22360 [Bacteroidota bacterium]